MLKYLLEEKKKNGSLPKKGVVFNTIVTSDLGAKVARAYGMDVVSTLTGFKFIGEQARFLEGTDSRFVFGYEESYGYLIDDRVRDKDSLQSMLLVLEAATYYRVNEGKSLLDKLQELYQRFGVHLETLQNIELYGIEGAKRIDRIVDFFRNSPLSSLAGYAVKATEDYQIRTRSENGSTTPLRLPVSNVIKYVFENDSWIVLRPSGTEPKLKIYIGVVDSSMDRATLQNRALTEAILKIVKQIA